MNRVLPAWANHQASIFEQRHRIPDNQYAHRFNTVISDRLERSPQRFFWGAVQSYLDLLDLTRAIKTGRHPYFAPGARVDFLGYSAGGYVSFLLLLEDAEGLFTDSRAALFASCVPARDLNLASPLILDLAAETALMKMFVKGIDVRPDARMRHWFQCHGEGRWFRALSGVRTDRQNLEGRIRELAGRVLGIANTNDEVMPLHAFLDTLQGLRRDTGVRVMELDLGLHENPFVELGGDRLSRRGLVEFLDEEPYGASFRRFIDAVASHLAPS
jgi:pimeloyl-ACP methyl ester carboxylesterase